MTVITHETGSVRSETERLATFLPVMVPSMNFWMYLDIRSHTPLAAFPHTLQQQSDSPLRAVSSIEAL